MTFTVLDIETAAGPLAQAEADALRTRSYPYEERFPPDNYKKEETIAKWRAADEAAWPTECNRLAEALLKEAALSPRLGRVVCVGVRILNDHLLESCTEEAEAHAVELAVRAIKDADTLVTFNGLTFDVPYLHVRAAVLGVRIPYPVGHYVRRYTTTPHADLRAVLTNWDNRTSGTLTEWCKAFGIESTDTTTGADIGKMVEAGDVEGIRNHCASDLELTYLLATKLNNAGLII